MPEYPQVKDSRGYVLSHYVLNSRWFAPGTVPGLSMATDGRASTIMGGEADLGFQPGGQPGNVRDPALGMNGGPTTFGHPRGDSVIFIFGDGRAKNVSTDIDPTVLRALSTPAGRETIPPDSY